MTFLISIQPIRILSWAAGPPPSFCVLLIFICAMVFCRIIDSKLVTDPLGFPSFLLWVEITILLQNAIVSGLSFYFVTVLALNAPIAVTPGMAPAPVTTIALSMPLALYPFA